MVAMMREGSENAQKLRVVAVLKQHGTYAFLPQGAEAGKFIRRRLSRHGFGHQGLHSCRERNGCCIEFQFNTGTVIQAAQCHQATDASVVIRGGQSVQQDRCRQNRFPLPRR